MVTAEFLPGLSAAFRWFRETLSFAPDWMLGPILIAAALIIALVVHSVMVAILRKFVSPQRIFLRSLLSRTKGPTRLALIILALGAAVQSSPLDPAANAALSQGLTIGFIILLGWTALIAIDLATDQYQRRFRLDVDDNLMARKHITQINILKRAADTLAIVITVALALMTFDQVRQYGVSLFASAGVAGIIAGLAARPVLSNMIAGMQIAMAQPIRIEDAVVVEGEFGWVEEITSIYVVLRLWDQRRLIVPLTYFIEKPFQNWTRQSSALIGAVLIEVDYTAPIDRIRQKLSEIVTASPLWDGKVVNLQVTEAKTSTLELRALVSARGSGAVFDLRCQVREKLIAFLQQEYPSALPRQRAAVDLTSNSPAGADLATRREPGPSPSGPHAGNDGRREKAAADS